MKNDRYGQAAIITEKERLRIKRFIFSPSHKLIFDIACFTGERWGAILKLRVDDCYADRAKMIPRKYILYRGNTRKRSGGVNAASREVPVHPELWESLARFKPPAGRWLFPSRLKEDSPITYQSADKALRQAVQRAGLSYKGISTHSTRRTFITRLSENGVDLRTIQALTGHSTLGSLQRYIEESPERKNKAINCLTF